MKEVKKILIMFLLSILLLGLDSQNVSAKMDTEASTYGFKVNNDEYYKTNWYNTVTTKVKMDGYIIGTCTTNIGTTRARDKASGGYRLDQIMIKSSMKGKYPAKLFVGYSEHLTLQSKLPSGTELVAYSPESIAGMRSYDIGLSASSDKTVGLSASTTVTKKALEINCYSDVNERLFKECYDYIHSILRFNWDVFNKYAYRESIQRAHYVVKTKKSKYDLKLVVKAKFQRWDDEPGYWADQYGQYSTKESSITFTTPY